jgi:uncharacterized membrane protein YagU involved in acid resistance
MKGLSGIVRSRHVFLLLLIFLCGFVYLNFAPVREGAGLSVGAIFGIVIACIVGVIVLPMLFANLMQTKIVTIRN